MAGKQCLRDAVGALAAHRITNGGQMKIYRVWAVSCVLAVSLVLHAGLGRAETELPAPVSLDQACRAISSKLASVDYDECRGSGMLCTHAFSSEGFPLMVKEYPPLENRQPQSRVLVLGGTHGDEYSSISIVFKWMQILDVHHSGLFHWVFVPLLNPDGLLRDNSTRTNHRGVDINRNFPSPLWLEVGYQRWVDSVRRNPRYYPGPRAMSEPETQFLVELIQRFRPHAIVSVHAPLGLVDYDGPGVPPQGLGSLPLRKLGNYPGTLGNYASEFGVPVLTIELDSAGRMPSQTEISAIWRDLVRWLVDSTPLPSWGVIEAHKPGPLLDEAFFAK